MVLKLTYVIFFHAYTWLVSGGLHTFYFFGVSNL